MNNKMIRYVGIGVLLIIAFVLFMSRSKSDYPYRAEIRSLQSENALTVSLFVEAYRGYEDEASYDLDTMEKQRQMLDWYIERYESLENLPEDANEDFIVLMETLEEQRYYFEVIHRTALADQPIPGEYALGLKKTIEKLALYEGRMARY